MQSAIHDAKSSAAGPFDLAEPAAYARWREEKLANYPADTDGLIVEIGDPRALKSSERRAIQARCRKANMAIYVCRSGRIADRDVIRSFAGQFGLQRIDRHLCADASGITAITVASHGRRQDYIPYTNRGLSWHTDGYYNPSDRPVRAIVLHCIRDAASGGENAMLDHEMAYIHLRDANPRFIEALAHPAAMTIPANREGGTDIRPARSGPVFSVDRDTGALLMRYTARKRNVVWRDDSVLRSALARLSELLDDPRGPVTRCKLRPGMGLIANNVLHQRFAFDDDPDGGRLIYRGRFFDRITGAQAGASNHREYRS